MTELSLNGQQFRKIRAGGRPGRTDPRGSAATRRSRKNWMLSPEAGFGGNGTHVLCTHCKSPLTFATVESDRKIPGGPYARHNVQPACRSCNLQRSNNTSWKAPNSVSA